MSTSIPKIQISRFVKKIRSVTCCWVEMSQSGVMFTAKAYCKLMLHAAKYPHAAVNGVLLTKNLPSKTKEIEFVDAVPLFHISLNLTPMAEVALTLIDQEASQQGLIIAGYYTAQENLRDCSIEKAYHRISDKIAENFGAACLVVVDNTKLSLHLDSVALKVAQYNDGKYRPMDMQRVSVSPANVLDICSCLLENGSYKSLVDFDNHLDDVSLDWMNNQINSEIELVL